MAKKKPENKEKKLPIGFSNAYINGGGQVVEEKITVTLEKNYMPLLLHL